MALIGYGLQKLGTSKTFVLTLPLLRRYKLIYSSIFLLALCLGILLFKLGVITISGKVAAALGLKAITHVIVSTVQEYASASPQEFMFFLGPTVIAVPLLVYYLYRVISNKDLCMLFLLSLFIFALVGTMNIAYFFSFLSYVTALIASCIASIALGSIGKASVLYRRSWFRTFIGISIIAVYLISIIAYGVTVWARSYRGVVPTLIEGGTGIGIDAPVWIDALRWIKEHTPRDAVIVAWWDYGYWISVIGERASVADGSTINTTQIVLLAKALTGTEDEAYEIFTKYFKIKPSKLYIVVYEFYFIDNVGRRVIVGPIVLGRTFLGADAAKAIAAMYRIAGRKPPTIVYAPPGSRLAYVLPDWSNPKLANATLFKILVNTAYVIWGPKGYKVINYFANPSNPRVVPKPRMTYFEPAYIAISACLPPSLYLVLSVYKCGVGS